MKICILYGGDSLERDVSLKTGQAIYDSINKQHEAFLYDFNGNYESLSENICSVDIVFNALHGGNGENGTVQRFLENKGVRFTGSNSSASAKAMDKNIAKLICKEHDIPTPHWAMASIEDMNSEKLQESFVNNDEWKAASIVVKPANEGSSVGITILKKVDLLEREVKLVKNAFEHAFKVSESVMLEEYIDGREITVSILNNEVLPIVEIIPKADYYDYKCKYTKLQSNYIVPAKIHKEIRELLSTYSLKIHKLIGCGLYSRLDYRLNNNGDIYFLEINTLPGFTDTSLFPKSALAAKISYNELINKIINLT